MIIMVARLRLSSECKDGRRSDPLQFTQVPGCVVTLSKGRIHLPNVWLSVTTG
jgi:hypothetical protein